MTGVADEYEIGRPTVHDIVKSEGKLRCFQSELQDNNCTNYETGQTLGGSNVGQGNI